MTAHPDRVAAFLRIDFDDAAVEQPERLGVLREQLVSILRAGIAASNLNVDVVGADALVITELEPHDVIESDKAKVMPFRLLYEAMDEVSQAAQPWPFGDRAEVEVTGGPDADLIGRRGPVVGFEHRGGQKVWAVRLDGAGIHHLAPEHLRETGEIRDASEYLLSAASHGEDWYAVRCVFAVGWPPEVAGRTYEERITLWQSASFDDAIELAEEDAEDYAAEIEDGPSVYLGVAQAYRLPMDPGHGAEVFSLLRTSDLEGAAYVTRFFDTGGEIQNSEH